MTNPIYRAHRIAETATHRVHSVQCLNDNGVVIALAATDDGRDYGLAICTRDKDGGWGIAKTLDASAPTIRQINEAGQFVGWSTKGGRERALVANATLFGTQMWPAQSMATSIDARGRIAAVRRARDGVFHAFVRDGEREVELQAPSADGMGCWPAAIGGDHIFGTAFDAFEGVLMWRATGELIQRFEVEFGQPVTANATGQLVCTYGTVVNGEHVWLPHAPRCSDFVARDLNAAGDVVGVGRALDGAGSHACVWRGGASYNLNDLVSDALAHLREASAINDSGWIACSDAEGDAALLEPLT